MKLKVVMAALCAVVAMSSYAAKVSKSVPKGWSEDFAAAQKTAEKRGFATTSVRKDKRP